MNPQSVSFIFLHDWHPADGHPVRVIQLNSRRTILLAGDGIDDDVVGMAHEYALGGVLEDLPSGGSSGNDHARCMIFNAYAEALDGCAEHKQLDAVGRLGDPDSGGSNAAPAGPA